MHILTMKSDTFPNENTKCFATFGYIHFIIAELKIDFLDK